MKMPIRLFIFAALVAALALPALAQTTPATSSTPTPAAQGSQDDAQAKVDLYNKLVSNRTTNPPVAYEAAKEYIQKYGSDSDQYVNYAKKYVAAYDKQARQNQFNEQLKTKNYNAAFASGKQILAEDPENLAVLYELSKAGFTAATSGNEANNADAAAYAKKTLQLLQAGKTFEPNKPVTGKNDIVGGLNYALGFLLRKTAPTEAATYFISAAQVDGFAKNDPQTYVQLAAIYEDTEYTRLAAQYQSSCKTDEQLKTAECTALGQSVNSVVDRMIDALARAIAYSEKSPDAAKYQAAREGWLKSLTAYYKYRNNNSDAGLKELIAGVTNKPLPLPGTTPATTAPASSGTATQPTGTSAAPSAPAGRIATPSTNTATPASTSQPTTTAPKTTPATTSQPNGKTTPKPAAATSKKGNHGRRS